MSCACIENKSIKPAKRDDFQLNNKTNRIIYIYVPTFVEEYPVLMNKPLIHIPEKESFGCFFHKIHHT